MKVISRARAWQEADRIFPTDKEDKTMTIMVMNKETDASVIYNNVTGLNIHGAIWADAKEPAPVFQLTFDDNTTATFHQNEWDLFVLKR